MAENWSADLARLADLGIRRIEITLEGQLVSVSVGADKLTRSASRRPARHDDIPGLLGAALDAFERALWQQP